MRSTLILNYKRRDATNKERDIPLSPPILSESYLSSDSSSSSFSSSSSSSSSPPISPSCFIKKGGRRGTDVYDLKCEINGCMERSLIPSPLCQRHKQAIDLANGNIDQSIIQSSSSSSSSHPTTTTTTNNNNNNGRSTIPYSLPSSTETSVTSNYFPTNRVPSLYTSNHSRPIMAIDERDTNGGNDCFSGFESLDATDSSSMQYINGAPILVHVKFTEADDVHQLADVLSPRSSFNIVKKNKK